LSPIRLTFVETVKMLLLLDTLNQTVAARSFAV